MESWIQTHSGKKVFPLNPSGGMIDIMDIAHALSNLCRYGGHTERFYSVAQHSIIVSEHVPDSMALTALLHDASEAYLCDIPAPIKQYFPEYLIMEGRLSEVIAEKFGLIHPLPAAIKEVDRAMLKIEHRDVMACHNMIWEVDSLPTLEGAKVLQCYEPRRARKMFLRRFEEITNEHAD